MKLLISPLAVRDMESIGDYIAQDNPRRAASFVRELRIQCEKLVSNPLAYRARPELGEGIRSCAHGNYTIFYRPNQDVVLIVRVLHGAMDIPEKFKVPR